MITRATSAKVARSADRDRLVEALGAWDRGTGPLHRQLARAIALAVDRGAVPLGTRLPSERELAAAVHVSRGTAVAAYDLLAADARIERRRGSGTFVSGADALLPEGREGTALVHRLVDASRIDAGRLDAPGGAGGGPAAGPDLIDLSLSVLPDATWLGDVRLGPGDLDAVDPPSGYSPWGLPGLRAALARLVTGWGLPSEADHVLVTAGAQQAISVAAACWVRPGDLVAVDEPTYPGAVAAFEQAGARLVGIPLDGRGPDPDALASALARRPALVYLQPVVHSPTGTTTSDGRRRRLVELLAAAGVPVVEDRSLADLSWTPPPPPLAADLPDLPTVVVGSLGKRYWGGLRLGFARAPLALSLRLARIKATQDLGTSVLAQVVAERLLRADGAGRPAAAVRELARRHRRFAGLLARAVPAWRWPEPAGGLSLWVDLGDTDGGAFSRVAREHGVVVAAPEPLLADGRPAPAVRLSFALDPARHEAAVARLATAWEHRPG